MFLDARVGWHVDADARSERKERGRFHERQTNTTPGLHLSYLTIISGLCTHQSVLFLWIAVHDSFDRHPRRLVNRVQLHLHLAVATTSRCSAAHQELEIGQLEKATAAAPGHRGPASVGETANEPQYNR